jgi:hypothetical protein
LHAVADGERVGMGRHFCGTGKDVQAAEDHFCAALAIPARQLVGAVGECEMDADADDLGKRFGRRAALKQIFVPIVDGPIVRRGGGDAGEGEGGGENVLSEAGVRILGIERIDEQRVAWLDGLGWRGRIEKWGDAHGAG